MKATQVISMFMVLILISSCNKQELLTNANQIDPSPPPPTSLTSTASWHTVGYCSGNYADDYNIVEGGVTYNAGKLGYWHNHALDYFFNNPGRIGNLDSLASPTFSSFDSIRLLMKDFVAANSLDIDDYSDVNVIKYSYGLDVDLGGMVERLSPVSTASALDSFLDLAKKYVDSMYSYSFIDADTKDVLYLLYDDMGDGNSYIDFATVYDSLDVFYASTDLSSQIAVSIIAIAEYSYCYWQDYGDYTSTPRWIWVAAIYLAAMDCMGGCIGTWTNAIDHYRKGTFNSSFGADELFSGAWQGAVSGTVTGCFGLIPL